MRPRLKFTAIGLCLALTAVACGDGTVSTSTTVVATSTSGPVASTTIVPTTTAADSSTTTSAVTLVPEPLAIPRLDNQLPATFVAVTEDWEAVEVDTATGMVLRSIGQAQTPDLAEEEGIVSGAIDRVVRTSDLQWFGVSECCEPAAGYIAYVRPGELYPEVRPASEFVFAWSAAPSPFDGRVATAGFEVMVGEVGGEPDIVVRGEVLGVIQPSGVIAFGRDGDSIYWVSNSFGDGGSTLYAVSLGDPAAELAGTDLEWVGTGQTLDGIGSQASGNLVGFLNTMDQSPEPQVIKTEGVVFGVDGGLVATFDVETGSFWGGYDPSGRMLIYTDGNNVVRWQGLGQSGMLAEGYLHVSW